MICRCFGRSFDTAAAGSALRRTAELMVGQPSYDAYAAHLAQAHPEQAPLSRAAFFREREAARFGVSRMRCC